MNTKSIVDENGLHYPQASTTRAQLRRRLTLADGPVLLSSSSHRQYEPSGQKNLRSTPQIPYQGNKGSILRIRGIVHRELESSVDTTKSSCRPFQAVALLVPDIGCCDTIKMYTKGVDKDRSPSLEFRLLSLCGNFPSVSPQICQASSQVQEFRVKVLNLCASTRARNSQNRGLPRPGRRGTLMAIERGSSSSLLSVSGSLHPPAERLQHKSESNIFSKSTPAPL